MLKKGNNPVLYHDASKVKVGGVMRYTVTGHDLTKSLFCRVRNTELSALRAAYLNGPYNLYIDMRPEDYDEYKLATGPKRPVYNYHLKPGQHFSFELPVLHSKQTWVITIQSEILFSRASEINFEITIAETEHSAKYYGSQAKKYLNENSTLEVIKQDTASIWQSPAPRPDEPLHICILTHGLMSNVTADLLYLKETIDYAAQKTGENLICKGYTGNVCRTARGIKYLGRRLARWIIDELIPTYKPQKLSFLAHSLGGPTQTYALGYIQATNPEALEGIELVNFVAFASPFLGISAENPGYVQFALDFGVVGKSGRDLALSWTPGKQKPLLERLPGEHTLTILRRFKHRTLYANAVHDGIVPLRTSALVFLDWYAIAEANMAYKAGKHHMIHYKQSHEKADEKSALKAKEDFEKEQKKRDKTEDKLERRQKRRERRHKSEHQETINDDESIGESSSDSDSFSETEEIDKNILSRNNSKEPEKNDKMDNVKEHTASPSKSPSVQSRDTLKSFLFEKKQAKIFSRYQTVNDNSQANDVGETLPHKTSLIENGIFILLPPHPSNDFITNPDTRENVIFHDRVYSEKDLPKRRYKSTIMATLGCGKDNKVEVAKREEKIARKYHHNLSWRKVLVSLLPEAHNNIIVRRRFSNAYGWPVVHHCVNEHFMNYEPDDKTKTDGKNVSDTESIDIVEQARSMDFNEISETTQMGGSLLQPPVSRGASLEVSSISTAATKDDPPWSESEDEIEIELDTDHDPQRTSMLKIIRNP